MDGAVYMKLFFSYAKTFDKLPDEDAGQLIKAMLRYAETGESVPPSSPMADLAFDFIKAQIDRDRKAFADGGKGGRPKKKAGDMEKENPPSENGKPPFTKSKTPLSENDNPPSAKPKPLKDKGIKDKGIKEVINNDTTRAREEETPFGTIRIDPIIVKVQKEIVGMTDTHYDLLNQYRDELGDELVSCAIDGAVAQGVRTWAYLETILLRYESQKFRTVADVKAAEAERKKSRSAPKGKTVTAQRFTQRDYTDSELEGETSPLLADALKRVMSG